MALTAFRKRDILFNTIKAHPKYNFFIYQNEVFLKDKAGLNLHPKGYENLYELNVNRQSVTDASGQEIGLIHPFITKDGARTSFRTVSSGDFDDSSQFQFGDRLTGSYPLTASISRIKIPQGSNIVKLTNPDDAPAWTGADTNKKYINALRAILGTHYGRSSVHYKFESSVADYHWDKGLQEMNLICVPSIFYGSGMKKGSVHLKSYVSGTLVGELHDRNSDGELIEATGSNVGSVAGVVLYEHGIIMLTGSWDVSTLHSFKHDSPSGANSRIKWTNFGSGMPKVTGVDNINLPSSSYEVAFEGVNRVPTVTLMAHAPKNMFNLSTNPTAIRYDDKIRRNVAVDGYVESSGDIKNIEKSRYTYQTASFVKQTVISKIGIYDEKGNLLAISSLANPVRKKEKDEYTFKLKLDF